MKVLVLDSLNRDLVPNWDSVIGPHGEPWIFHDFNGIQPGQVRMRKEFTKGEIVISFDPRSFGCHVEERE